MASSSSSSPSTTAFSSPLWKYPVFINFRYVDICKSFVDHLYTALVKQGIVTYMDDGTLPEGESISPSLNKTIEDSEIAVMVFSENYAYSTRCLDELACIMRCRDTKGKITVPVFYDICPYEVERQRGKYGEALAKYELENNKKVESWRKALMDAGRLTEWELAHGHDSKRLHEIVVEISKRLDHLAYKETAVAMDARVEELESKLQIGSGGVSMIGIVGVEGGGKTTLASSIYDKISREFDDCCFVENIREKSSKINGLEDLQAEIISEVSKQKKVRVGRVVEGRSNIATLLRFRKVLLILDDMDHVDHLKDLVGYRDWYDDRTRIIVTTRDEHLLTAYGVNVIHNIRLSDNVEAITIFLKHAFRRCKIGEDYKQVSEDVVSYAGGIPLALTVLGSFLCGKNINEWRNALARWKQIPDGIFHISDWVKKLRWNDLNIDERVQAARSWPKDFLSRALKERKGNKDVEHFKIPLHKLTLATNNFGEECVIAKGGFGRVYKAEYKDCIVALKRLDPRSNQGGHEFNMEIKVLSAYAHKNLVSLIGFCDQGDEKILVYEYESNGSLDKHILRKDLTWIQCLQICLDAARGLMYLHDGVGTQHRILHCDIKSSNILLDENFIAKISDFGLSKIGLSNVPNTALISRVCGTIGYIDPEYYEHDILTQKSDVYSFGVVMFEVLCGKVVRVSKHHDDHFSPKLVKKHYEKGTLDEIIDYHLRNQMNSTCLTTFSTIAHQCLKCPGKERPSMAMVVKQLEKALVYQQDISLG